MNKDQKNKTLLITGASSGIGYELARIHASRGGDLVLVARRENLLKEHSSKFATDFGITAEYLAIDVTEDQSAQKTLDFIKSKNMTIDYFANNAGFGSAGKFCDKRIEKDLGVIKLNIQAFTEWLHAFANYLKDNRGGKILNIGSTAGLTPGGPNQATYFASKAYVNSLSRALHQELKSSNVSVTLLCPGATETEFFKTAQADHMEIAKNTASAYKVALDGYNAMLNSKLEVVSGAGLYLKTMLKIMPLVPTKFILKEIEKAQD